MHKMKHKYIQIHPDEKLINDSCIIEIMNAEDGDGYNMYVVDEDANKVVINEWEPDFEWVWQTAKYFSKKLNLKADSCHLVGVLKESFV